MDYKVYFLRDFNGVIKYVGQTRQPLKKRLFAHKSANRFPHTNYTIELVESFATPEPMYVLETKLIEDLNLVIDGWNKEYGKTKVPKQTSQAGENNQFYKHSHREEVRKAIGLRSIGNKYAVGSKSRRGLKNSKEHNRALSDYASKLVLCHQLDVVFFSARKAAQQLKLQESKVTAVCRGTRRTTGGYTFEYLKPKGSHTENCG